MYREKIIKIRKEIIKGVNYELTKEKGRRGAVDWSPVSNSTVILFRLSIISFILFINIFPINATSNKGRKSNLMFPTLLRKGSLLVRMILVIVLPAWTFIINSSRLRPKYKKRNNTSIKEHNINYHIIMYATYPSSKI